METKRETCTFYVCPPHLLIHNRTAALSIICPLSSWVPAAAGSGRGSDPSGTRLFQRQRQRPRNGQALPVVQVPLGRGQIANGQVAQHERWAVDAPVRRPGTGQYKPHEQRDEKRRVRSTVPHFTCPRKKQTHNGYVLEEHSVANHYTPVGTFVSRVHRRWRRKPRFSTTPTSSPISQWRFWPNSTREGGMWFKM